MTENVSDGQISWQPGPDEFGALCLLYGRDAAKGFEEDAEPGLVPVFPSAPWTKLGMSLALFLISWIVVRYISVTVPILLLLALNWSCNDSLEGNGAADSSVEPIHSSDTDSNPAEEPSSDSDEPSDTSDESRRTPADFSSLGDSRWRVVQRNYEQPLLDETIFQTGGTPAEWWKFESSGRLQWQLESTTSTCPHTLRTGTWKIEGGKLNLQWEQASNDCAGTPSLDEHFEGTHESEEKLTLRQTSASWSYRVSEAPPLLTQWQFVREDPESVVFSRVQRTRKPASPAARCPANGFDNVVNGLKSGCAWNGTGDGNVRVLAKPCFVRGPGKSVLPTTLPASARIRFPSASEE